MSCIRFSHAGREWRAKIRKALLANLEIALPPQPWEMKAHNKHLVNALSCCGQTCLLKTRTKLHKWSVNCQVSGKQSTCKLLPFKRLLAYTVLLTSHKTLSSLRSTACLCMFASTVRACTPYPRIWGSSNFTQSSYTYLRNRHMFRRCLDFQVHC